MTGRFAGQGWVVTGETRGIGRAIAHAAAGEGATVVLCGRGRPGVVSHAGVHHVTADVTRENEVDRLFDEAEAHTPRVDVVVTCARPAHRASLVDATLAEWRAALDENLRAPFLVCRRAVEELLATGGGAIVNVASFVAGGMAGAGADAAVNGGLLAMTRTIAKEVGRAHIRCNAVVPGRLDATPPGAALGADHEALAPSTAGVVEAVLFLASAEASFVQGDALHVAHGPDEAPGR